MNAINLNNRMITQRNNYCMRTYVDAHHIAVIWSKNSDGRITIAFQQNKERLKRQSERYRQEILQANLDPRKKR